MTRVAASGRGAEARGDFDRAFWLFAALIVPVTLLTYQPVWHGGFLWDDDGHVTKEALRSIGGIWRIWFEPGATQQYYPFVHTAFWLQYHVWGLETTGYHVINILLHAGSACLLMACLRRLHVPGAWLAGALFALHPIQVESVAWITELKNTLSGALYFGAGLAYLRFDAQRSRGAYALALGLFTLALFSKSVTATLPAGLLVVFWWKRGRIEWRRDVVPLLPFVVLGAAVGAMTVWMERTFIGAEGAAFNFSVIERVLIAGRALLFYLAMLAWPVNLAFSYARWTVSQGVWWQYLYPAAILVLTAALWAIRHRTRGPLAALLYFIVTLGPALGFVNVYPFKFSFVADHFQYLASAGIFAIVAAGLVTLMARREPWTAAVILVPLVWLSWRDSHAFTDNETLYRTTLARNSESWLAHSNLAGLLLERQPPNAAEALPHAREAVRLAPDQPATHFNLGLALEASNEPAAAVDEYRAALARTNAAEQKSARVAFVHDRLAAVLRAAGRQQEADEEAAISRSMLGVVMSDAAKAGAGTIDAQAGAAVALVQAGRAAEAIEPLTRVLQQAPGNVEAGFALGLALQQTQQPGPAAQEFQRVIAIQPLHAGAYRHLGQVLQTMGRRPEAADAYRAAIRLEPAVSATHNDLGVVLAQLGRFQEAEAEFAEAVRLDPSDAGARDNLDKARQVLRR
ncbi:MAG TPA: tetratricopeptide repeat protein, partial [Vicinamibacterales bacterium]|nr:tetratricopeptide repeat protein [Vicinamibacterales bacterium]